MFFKASFFNDIFYRLIKVLILTFLALFTNFLIFLHTYLSKH